MQLDSQASNNLNNSDNQSKGRLVVISMLIFFLVPIVVVIMMYKFNWKPSTGYSLGELVTPARLVDTPAQLKNSENQ